MKFGALQIEDNFAEALKKQKIEKPTEIQEQVYESILLGKNVIAQSETGSGKTLAYLLPLYERYKDVERENRVLILVPTQELALQVHRQIELLSKNAGVNVKSATAFGNVKIERQIESLKEKPLFIVGTAARIVELIKKRKIAAHLIGTIVFDEADKLLDKKVLEDTRAVSKCCLRDCQKLFFSASIKDSTQMTACEMAPQAVVIRKKETKKIPSTISHEYVVVKKNERLEILRKLLSAMKNQKVIIFINGAYEIEKAYAKLLHHSYSVGAIYGKSDKEERKRVVEGFRNGSIKYLIATDIAARGLQFDGMDAVIHMTLPQEAPDYQHRAGRCGRNQRKGRSISIITENELPHLKQFAKNLGFQLIPCRVMHGKLTESNSTVTKTIERKTSKRK